MMTPRPARRPKAMALGVGLPIALLVFGALARDARPFVLVALLAGTAIAIRRDASARWGWSAALPIAVALCWGLLPTPLANPSGADCANPLSPPAAWRVGESGVVLASIAILTWALPP